MPCGSCKGLRVIKLRIDSERQEAVDLFKVKVASLSANKAFR